MSFSKKFNFVAGFKIANLISLVLFLSAIILIFFKGLNLGIDFKGGTLIELRVDPKSANISQIRSSFMKMNLGDLNVKEFGTQGDYLIKFEKKNININIQNIKNNIQKDLQTDINFRRVESVGPKVSDELFGIGINCYSSFLGSNAILYMG